MHFTKFHHCFQNGLVSLAYVISLHIGNVIKKENLIQEITINNSYSSDVIEKMMRKKVFKLRIKAMAAF